MTILPTDDWIHREVTTYAGNIGNPGSTDGIGGLARFNSLFGISTDGINLYVGDTLNHTIRKIVIATGEVSTLAGSPGDYGHADGNGTDARFNWPRKPLYLDGILYISDSSNCTIRKLNLVNNEVSTLAGSAGNSGYADGDVLDARFSLPREITTDGTNLYITDSRNHIIRKIELGTGIVSTFAGSAGNSGMEDGTGTLARFNNPIGITTDGESLYVADYDNHTIRKIIISTQVVSTLAGSAGQNGSADGTGSEARFNNPIGICIDGKYIFVSDLSSHTIRRINSMNNEVITWAGVAGDSGIADGIGASARFDFPCGLTCTENTLYLCDWNNHAIRRITE